MIVQRKLPFPLADAFSVGVLRVTGSTLLREGEADYARPTAWVAACSFLSAGEAAFKMYLKDYSAGMHTTRKPAKAPAGMVVVHIT